MACSRRYRSATVRPKVRRSSCAFYCNERAMPRCDRSPTRRGCDFHATACDARVRARARAKRFFLPLRSGSDIPCGTPQYPIVTSASLYPIDIESFDRHGSWEDRREKSTRRSTTLTYALYIHHIYIYRKYMYIYVSTRETYVAIEGRVASRYRRFA